MINVLESIYIQFPTSLSSFREKFAKYAVDFIHEHVQRVGTGNCLYFKGQVNDFREAISFHNGGDNIKLVMYEHTLKF